MAKPLLIAILFLGAGAGTYADETPTGQVQTPGNGVYLQARDGEPGVAVPHGAQDGTLRVGALMALPIRGVEVRSESNANDHWQVTVTTDWQADPAAALPRVLVIDGVAWPRRAHGSTNQETCRFVFQPRGEAMGLAVAKHFRVTPHVRRHPGHRLLTRFTPTTKSWSADGPYEVELTLKNVGKTRVSFMQGGQQRGLRDNQFSFVAFGPQGLPVSDIGDPTHFGGIAAHIVLEPGETHRQTVDLRKWFKLEKGVQAITGHYDLTMMDPQDTKAWRVLWDDTASATFVVTVGPPAPGFVIEPSDPPSPAADAEDGAEAREDTEGD